VILKYVSIRQGKMIPLLLNLFHSLSSKNDSKGYFHLLLESEAYEFWLRFWWRRVFWSSCRETEKLKRIQKHDM